MDAQPQASFIPKKPLDSGPLVRGQRGVFGGLFFLLGLFVFIVSIVGAAGVFGYQNFLQNSIADKADSLKKAEGAFDPAVITELIRIDSRINQSQLLLQKHVAPSGIFTFLAAQTLQQVQFESFEYVLGDDNSAKIILKGQADNFSTIALQSDQFSASKVLKNVVFSGILLGTNGKVLFTVVATVDPSLINYTQNLGTASTVQTSPQVAESSANTSTTTQTQTFTTQ